MPTTAGDVTIRGAEIVDGSGGRAPFRGEVVVRGGRITAVSERPSAPSGPVLDADGLVLAPGFFDMHSHADFTLPVGHAPVNSVAQGVTTEVLGNCGFSPAPLSADAAVAAETVRISRAIATDIDWSWRTFGEYLDALDATAPPVNCVALAGHNPIRVAAMGGVHDRAPTDDELDRMRAGLQACLDEGAWGMSTGLVYAPGAYADDRELEALGRVLGDAGALYASHLRNEGEHLVEAVEEAIRVAGGFGAPVQVSHLKAIGPANRGRVRDALAVIEAARARGVDVHCDVYPYRAGATFLSQLLPPWAHDGGIDTLLERLESQEVLERLRGDVDRGRPGWVSLAAAAGGWRGVVVLDTDDERLGHCEGRSIEDIARERRADPFDTVVDLLRTTRGGCTMAVFVMDPDDVATVVRHRLAAVGSDQFGVVPGARVHPRSYGTFARFLSQEYRASVGLDLVTAVHKMSGLAADIVGLRDRGRIREGAVADLVAFDAATVADRASYAEPTARPDGVEHVLLAGVAAVRDGNVVDASLGRVLRRPEFL